MLAGFNLALIVAGMSNSVQLDIGRIDHRDPRAIGFLWLPMDFRAPIGARAGGSRRPVRHAAPAPHQDRRARRRDEDDVARSFADIVSRSEYPALRAGTYTATRHLSRGT